MSLSNKTKRERNVAHLWVDKRVSRFIRRNFKGKQRRTLRDVYLALCEIESDFTQQRNNPNFGIPHLGKLCATYSGITEETAYEAMGAFKKMGLIDYAQNKGEKGQYGKGSYLTLWTWDDEENYIENLNSPVPGETRDRVLPVPGETRDRLSPGSVKPGNFKNPSGEKQESFQEGKLRVREHLLIPLPPSLSKNSFRLTTSIIPNSGKPGKLMTFTDRRRTRRVGMKGLC